MEKPARFEIPHEELLPNEVPGKSGVYSLGEFPEGFYGLPASEAVVCSGTWGEMALAIRAESEEAYMLSRDDLRNPWARVRIYVPKASEGAEAKFRSAVEEIVRGIPSWIGDGPEEVKFPVEVCGLSVKETAGAIRLALLSNPVTNSCFESVVDDEAGVSAVLDIAKNAVRRRFESLAYEGALSKTIRATNAVETERLAKFKEGTEDYETVKRVFAHVRRSEVEFLRHVHSKLRNLFEEKGGHAKFKDIPADGAPRQTVVLWDIDETVTYNDSRMKKSIVRPAFLPLMELLATVAPQVRHGILTSRSDARLKNQLADQESEYSLAGIAGSFDSEYVFWRESYADANLGNRYGFYVSKEEPVRIGYEDKVRGFHFVNQKFPSVRFLLVDDVLQSHFENLGGWVRLEDHMCARAMEALPLPD